MPGLSLYTASKFAVRGLSLAAATELSRHEVAVTVARGALARAANTAPGISKYLAPMLLQKGLAAQERIRGEKKSS